MPLYDFKCETCKRIVNDRLLKITHTKSELPTCCNKPMGYFITTVPFVHWVDPVIEPFRAIATKDRPLIRTTRENREYMARNNLIDANELGSPPSNTDQERAVAEMQKSIDAITPTGQLADDMKKRGMLDVLES